MAYGVKIITKSLDDEEVSKIIIDFANNTENYSYKEEYSRRYRIAIESPAFIIDYENSKGCVGYAIAKSNSKYNLENIVPREPGFIPSNIADEYVTTLVNDFRIYLKKNGNKKIKISINKRKVLDLKEIIPGEKTRKYFQTYINCYPLSHHPLDKQRLDVFICAAFRYCRKTIDTELLYNYLCEILNWPENECKWCCGRIKAGLEILKVNKKF